jgi:hypothetical protein
MPDYKYPNIDSRGYSIGSVSRALDIKTILRKNFTKRDDEEENLIL